MTIISPRLILHDCGPDRLLKKSPLTFSTVAGAKRGFRPPHKLNE
jgi:hypothetical protein